MMTEIRFELNGEPVSALVASHWRLLDVLRGPLGLTGTKEGCGEGECGACTVLVDGQAVNACLYPAMEAEGRCVRSIEGLSPAPRELSPLQRAFTEHGAIQCGFCTPGMIMAAQALLDQNNAPCEQDIRDALQGNLCRCTGYVQIVAAVQQAALALNGAERGERHE